MRSGGEEASVGESGRGDILFVVADGTTVQVVVVVVVASGGTNVVSGAYFSFQ